MTRLRADALLVQRGFFGSRARAQEAIAAGLVKANGEPVKKPAQVLEAESVLEAAPLHPWVSRGGLKLVAGLNHFGIDPKDLTCLDLGASTGGFTHVLLEREAAKVTCVDVGHDQLHPDLRINPRVVVMEGMDARSLTPGHINPAPDLLVCDASFISLQKLLPIPLGLAASGAFLIALIKPQFEAGRALVGKGIVRDPAVHAQVCSDIAAFVTSAGWAVRGIIPSPITGGDGNCEFLIGARRT